MNTRNAPHSRHPPTARQRRQVDEWMDNTHTQRCKESALTKVVGVLPLQGHRGPQQ